MEYYSEKKWCVKNGREPFEVKCFYDTNEPSLPAYYLCNEYCYTPVDGDMFFVTEADAILAYQTLLANKN